MQATNQPTNQPTNQTTKQPTKQPTIQPNNQPTNQTTNQPTKQPIYHSKTCNRKTYIEKCTQSLGHTSKHGEIRSLMRWGRMKSQHNNY